MRNTEWASIDVSIGDTVYDSDGTPLGEIRAVDTDGFYVGAGEHPNLTVEGAQDLFGRPYAMWCCLECGEMGELAEFPDGCPACDAPKEGLCYRVED